MRLFVLLVFVLLHALRFRMRLPTIIDPLMLLLPVWLLLKSLQLLLRIVVRMRVWTLLAVAIRIQL
jgi:hypothetical protein